MTASEPEKKSTKRKELSVGQLKVIASDLARELPRPAEGADGWREFARLPQSERRKVVDLLSEGVRETSAEGLIRLSRMTLTGGVANKHEAALKSVVSLCSRCLNADERREEVLRQLLIDLIDPTPLAPTFSLPQLQELDPQEVATLPGIPEALGGLFTAPIPSLPLGVHVRQWARLLAAIMVTSAASASLNSEVAAAVLGVARGLPLKARPLELRLAERVLEDMAHSSSYAAELAEGSAQKMDAPRKKTAKAEAPDREIQDTISISQALEILQRGIARLEDEQRERRSALAATIESLETSLQNEKRVCRDLEDRCGRFEADFQKHRTEAVALKADLELVSKERDAAREERETLQRELALVGGIGTAAIEAAKADVRKNFIRLSLLPLQSVRAFSERLRANSTVENPDLLIVPLRTIIQVLHSQGFATDMEIQKI